jgi:fucose permease
LWSGGALLGSAVGTIAAHEELSAQVHHLIAAVVLTVIGALVCQFVLNIHPEEDTEPPARFALPPKSALLIGAVGFCAVFAEGASLDWSAVYLRDVLDSSAGVAAGATTGFALTMTIARLTGDAVVDRFGVVPTVRWSGVIATLGGLLVVLAPNPVLAMVGFGLIGIGIAVVVPLAFAAAGHTGPNPSQAIAGVATITYASGLVAPSIIGGIAQASSLTASFIVVTVLATGLAVFARVLATNHRTAPNDVLPR